MKLQTGLLAPYFSITDSKAASRASREEILASVADCFVLTVSEVVLL